MRISSFLICLFLSVTGLAQNGTQTQDPCENLLATGVAVPSSAQIESWIDQQFQSVLEDLAAVSKLKSAGSMEPVSQVDVNGVLKPVDNLRLMELAKIYYEATHSHLLADFKAAHLTTSNLQSIADRMPPLREAVRKRYLRAVIETTAIALKSDPLYKDLKGNILGNYMVMSLLTLQTDRLRPLVVISGDISSGKSLLTTSFSEKLHSINHGYLHVGEFQYHTNITTLAEILEKANSHQIAVGLRQELFRRALIQTLPRQSIVILDFLPQEFLVETEEGNMERLPTAIPENAALNVKFLNDLLDFSSELRTKKGALLVVNVHSPLVAKVSADPSFKAIAERVTLISVDAPPAGPQPK